MKYIDAEKLKAEIKKRLKNVRDYMNGTGMKYKGSKYFKAQGKESAYDALLSTIDSLQQEQKSAEWSEEDEHRYGDAIYFLETTKMHYADTSEIELAIDWLKSLRPQPHWKPSEEQMRALSETIAFAPGTFKPKCTLMTLQNDLKKL